MRPIAISHACQLTVCPALQLEDAALLADSPVQEHPSSDCMQPAFSHAERADQPRSASFVPWVYVFKEPIPALCAHQSSLSYRPSSLETLA
ncbi:MAG: hypothetical protein AAF679_03400 [Pseudomonadota bacterium]